MSTPYQDWITETNSIAEQGKNELAERLSARLIDKAGPPPTSDDINWLDLIIDAYSNATVSGSANYAQVVLDWLDDFQHRFGRTEISAQTVTLVCSALSFWEACPQAFTDREPAHIRAFVSAYLDRVTEFSSLPAPLNDAGTNLHEQIMRLHYTGPGSENLPKEALLGRWLGVPQDEASRSKVRPNLRNNRYIIEALALHFPDAITYDWAHHIFRDSKVLPENERDAFLEHTFTNVDLSERWTHSLVGSQSTPRDRFFEELRTRFSPDDFESIDETLRFLDQVFWMAGDESGQFAKWKSCACERAIEAESRGLISAINPSSDHHVIKAPYNSGSMSQRIGYVMSLNIFADAEYRRNGNIEAANKKKRTRRFLLRYQRGLKNENVLNDLREALA